MDSLEKTLMLGKIEGSNTLSPSLMPNTANAFKIDIGGSEPNTKITTVVILN